MAGSDPGDGGGGEECGVFDSQQAGETQRPVDDHGAGNVGRHRATLVGKKTAGYGSNREARKCWNPLDARTFIEVATYRPDMLV